MHILYKDDIPPVEVVGKRQEDRLSEEREVATTKNLTCKQRCQATKFRSLYSCSFCPFIALFYGPRGDRGGNYQGYDDEISKR